MAVKVVADVVEARLRQTPGEGEGYHLTPPFPPHASLLALALQAVGHINSHSSHHTDAIVTADPASVRFFTQFVDSAGVFVNVRETAERPPRRSSLETSET